MNKPLFFLIAALTFSFIVQAQDDRQEIINDIRPLNKACFDCHGQQYYTYTNESTGQEVRKEMCESYLLDDSLYYQSNHFSFACIDCHSGDYESYPHPPTVRMEQLYTCTDCHGFTETDEKYQFSKIEDAYYESVHYELEGDNFSCWDCHDPHSYVVKARRTTDIKEIISYNNAQCLECHTNEDKFKLLIDEKMSVLEQHDWLPNQQAHFNSVRCIECHTAVDNELLIAHKVMPADSAVHNCVECHSQNSLLLSTLYKHQVKENRKKNGFVNGVILNDSYVIGASRNETLNKVSIALFILTLGGILVHALLRIFITKKR
jgi:hypothetical protein